MANAVTVFWITVAMFASGATASAGELIVGDAQAQPSAEVTVPITYRQGTGPAAAGLATDIRFPKGLTQPRCAPGAALSGGQKTVKCAEPKPGLLRVAVFGLNLDAIPDGEVATVTFQVSPGARPGSYRLRNRPSAADAEGKDYRLRHHDGMIRIGH